MNDDLLHTGPAPDLSVVVIGRNEGERLRRCLASVAAADWGDLRHEVLYVDSRSTDGSVGLALARGARCVVLADERPCAAKARNLGWRHARGALVLFLDGDTELHPDFVGHALRALSAPEVCAVWGHRRESRPGQSIYTRLLDLDWLYRPGRVAYFGGDVLMRRAALEAVGGFDPALGAGEEPELSSRLRQAGWQIEHLDVPMTRHDLAITDFRAYARRAYRSGLAYAEVAERMRQRGDAMWQREARRDWWQGGLMWATGPLLLALALLSPPVAGAALALLTGLAALMLVRTAWRCAWKAPGRPGLLLAYAAHLYLQKMPAWLGQWHWRSGRGATPAPDYKAPAPTAGPRGGLKQWLMRGLCGPARLRRVVLERWVRLWSAARLAEALPGGLHASNVVLGPVELHGTRQVRIGRGCLLYPDIYLETQGDGRIEIGDGVVLSRGVHIVAFDEVRLGDGVMVGEYSSVRDADHRRGPDGPRHSGHLARSVYLMDHAWVGRGASILKGVQVGQHGVVAANAVVTHDVQSHGVVAGIPARPLGCERPLPSYGM